MLLRSPLVANDCQFMPDIFKPREFLRVNIASVALIVLIYPANPIIDSFYF